VATPSLPARTILIVKVAAVGDAVMALPMLSALRAMHPDAHLTWLCGKSIRPLLDAIPGIDAVREIDDSRLFSRNRAQRVAEVVRTWRVLKGKTFDLVLLAHRDRRYRLLTLPLRYRELRKLGAGRRAGPLCGRSHADEYVRMVTGLDDWHAQRFAPPQPTIVESAASGELIRFAAGRPVVALAPGGARNAARTSPLKRWPLDRYVRLAERLAHRGFGVVVVGDPTEAWVSDAFGQTAALDLVGRTTIPELLGVLARCAATVAHDSGPLHLATLTGCPVVALFGPTHPDAFAARDRPVHVLWPGQQLPCAPCYDGREFAACDNNLCMQMIEIDDVMHRLDGFMQARLAPDARRPRS